MHCRRVLIRSRTLAAPLNLQGVATASLTPDDVPETVIPELPYNATAPVSAGLH